MTKTKLAEKHQEFVDALKFTPITVQVMIQGYGGESYAGTVDRKIYDYFKEHKIDINEFAQDWDDNFAFVPAEMQPFTPGSPYDCDNMWHASGAELDGTNLITITGPDGDIWEHSLDYSELEDAGVEIQQLGGCDLDDDDIPEGKVVYNGAQGEKGCFFDGEFTLRAPFDPKKLKISYENCGGWYIVNYVEYDGEEIDGSGGYSTTGKWGENKWILPGNEEVYESVSYEDREEEFDPVAELEKIAVPLNFTPWFESDVKPAYKGEYEVSIDASWPNSGVIRAEWTGQTWKDLDGSKVKIKGWRGLAENPQV